MVVVCLQETVDDLWPREGAVGHVHPLHPMTTMEDEGMSKVDVAAGEGLLESDG